MKILDERTKVVVERVPGLVGSYLGEIELSYLSRRIEKIETFIDRIDSDGRDIIKNRGTNTSVDDEDLIVFGIRKSINQKKPDRIRRIADIVIKGVVEQSQEMATDFIRLQDDLSDHDIAVLSSHRINDRWQSHYMAYLEHKSNFKNIKLNTSVSVSKLESMGLHKKEYHRVYLDIRSRIGIEDALNKYLSGSNYDYRISKLGDELLRALDPNNEIPNAFNSKLNDAAEKASKLNVGIEEVLFTPMADN